MLLFQPVTRVLLLFFVSFFVVFLDSLWGLLGVLGLGYLLLFLNRTKRHQWKILLLFSLVTVWSIVLTQGLFYQRTPRTILWTLISSKSWPIGLWTGGVHLYVEGLLDGFIQSLRLVITLTWGLALIWSTDGAALLRALRQLKLPYGMAFMMMISLRFIPLVGRELRLIWMARKLRGGRLFSWSPSETLRIWLSFFRPLLANNLRRAWQLADAAEGRGFSPELELPFLPLKLPLTDRLALSFLLILLLTLLFLKMLFFLYQTGIFYHPELRFLYDIAHLL